MTWSKFHKNCIFTGLLDGYCLVCEDHLKTEDEYLAHIGKPVHKKNLEATLYFEKYKQEFIRKVKKGYYCEVCNIIFYTASKVSLHVVDVQHNNKKTLHQLKRIDTNNKLVIAFDNVIIDDNSWNGFIDDTCVICNAEFDNMLIHKAGQEHILNLIQTKVEFFENESVYRKIDESSYQCLTCNLVMALDTFSTHFQDENHKDTLKSCRVSGETILKEAEKNVPKNTTVEATVKAEPVTKNEPPTETVKAPTKQDIKQANESVAKDESDEKKNKAVDEQTNKVNKKTTPVHKYNSQIKNAIEMDKYICDVLNANNFITRDGEVCMCILCDWAMVESVVPSHLTSRHHRTILRLHNERLQKLSKPEPVPVQVEKDVATDENREKVLDSLEEFQKNDLNINFEMMVASCKKCVKSLQLDYDVLKKHIEEHKNKPVKKETKHIPLQHSPGNNKESANTLFTKPVLLQQAKDNEDNSRAGSVPPKKEQIEIFARMNNLTYSNDKVTCTVCNVKLSASMKFLKEHVDGVQHKNKMKTARVSVTPIKSSNVMKVSMAQFMNSAIGLKNSFTHDLIINEKYTVSELSFWLITEHFETLKCEICDVNIEMSEFISHRETPRHVESMRATMVVASIENEFIREPRPDVYHCGFCNEAAEGWPSLVDHMASSTHRHAKNSAAWRLREYTVEIGRHKFQESMEKAFLQSLLMGRFNGSNDSSDDEW